MTNKKKFPFWNIIILYNSESELNEKIVKKIHPAEKELLKEFLVAYLMSGKNN